ncbi:MAG: sugar phosphate nucleotidyltransferase [bacterium]
MGGRLVILAGGISSRMRQPTLKSAGLDARLIEDAKDKAKSMIGVGRNYRPFLDYLLFNAREAGYKDVVMVVSEKDDSIRNYYGTKDRGNDFHGLAVSYAVQKIPPGRIKPPGTADALLQALKIRGDWQGKKFTVCNSDNLYSQKALRLLLHSTYPNAMIDYDRSTLQFEESRIQDFAVTEKDDDNFLVNIIEKPSWEDIELVKSENGVIGVSMNIFQFDYDMILPFLERIPLHPVRLEKELPSAVVMMLAAYPKSVYAFPLCEHVPDLTNRVDILSVKDYLDKFQNFVFE